MPIVPRGITLTPRQAWLWGAASIVGTASGWLAVLLR